MGEAAGPGEDRGDRVGRGRLALLVLAVVARHRAVGGLGLDRLAVRRHQHRGHQAERAEALGGGVRLHVAVVVLAGPDIAAGPLEAGRDHVVDQAVLVGEAERLELRLELLVEHLLEQILEATVIGLQDGVFGREVDRVLAGEAVVERGPGEVDDRLIEVVHRHRDAGVRELEHLLLDDGAVVALELDGEAALARHLEVGGAVLVAVGVAADHEGLGPARHEARHVRANDGLAEDHATEDVADRTVGRAPHLLELELLDAGLVRCDRRAFHADAVALDRLGRIDRHLIVGGVAVLDAEIVIVEVEIEVGVDELVLDLRPDDPGHLVAVELDDRIGHLDLRHVGPSVARCRAAGRLPSARLSGTLSPPL